MKHSNLKNLSRLTAVTVGMAGLAILPASALGSTEAANHGAAADTSTSTSSAADTKLVQLIITKGNNEIVRRLSTLNKLSSKISSDTKLSSSDKSALSSEVTSEVNGLTSLKATLDAETTAAAAKTDAQSIIDDYRVYALIAPKVYLIKTADDQQVAEGKLSSLATKLQADITADQNAGKDVASLQTQLNDMTAKTQAAQTISSTIESNVVGLQPSDYNSDHTVLSGDRDQLKTAQSDIAAAVTDAKNIVSSLKTL